MIAFSVFGFNVYWYGIFYLISFVFGYLIFLLLKRHLFIENYAKNFYLLLKKSPEDIILYVVLWVFVWGRLWHIFIYDFAYYIQNPIRVFFFWEGGMSFIGGIVWVFLFLLFLFRRYNFSWKDFFVLTDSLIISTWFWIMLWRIGNFLNQELYGRLVIDVFPNLSSTIVDFFSKIGVFYIYDRVDWYLRVNTNLLSSFFEWFIIFSVSFCVLFYYLRNKKRRIWFLTSFFVVWYSFIRFLFEYLRMDSQSEFVWFFTKSQRFFLFFLVFWILMLFVSLKKRYIK